MKTVIQFASAFLLLIAIATTSSTATAQSDSSNIGAAMDKVAAKVHEVIGEMKRGKQVVVGDFISRGRIKSSGGVELGRQLSVCLEKAGLEVTDSSENWTELSGSFKMVEGKAHASDGFESLGMQVTVEFYNEDGDPLKIHHITVDGEKESPAEIAIEVYGDDALAVGGVSYDVAPDKLPPEKQKEIIKQYKKPPTHVEGEQVRGKQPFGVEVLVDQNGKYVSRTPVLDGRKNAFVELHQGEEYAVKVYNDADFAIAVGLNIDGVSMFCDAQDISPSSRHVVRPHSHKIIKGWYLHRGGKDHYDVDNKPLPTTKAFLISGYKDSVAKRHGVKESNVGIGTISVDIRAAWPKNGTPPPGEKVGGSKGALATSHGKALDVKYKVASDLVFSPHTRSLIHVRYNK